MALWARRCCRPVAAPEFFAVCPIAPAQLALLRDDGSKSRSVRRDPACRKPSLSVISLSCSPPPPSTRSGRHVCDGTNGTEGCRAVADAYSGFFPATATRVGRSVGRSNPLSGILGDSDREVECQSIDRVLAKVSAFDFPGRRVVCRVTDRCRPTNFFFLG